MLLHVAAEDKRVGSLEQALVAAEGLAWSVLQFLVQVEIVFALAAVAALVTVKRALAGVDAHVLDQLVGRLGQVATLVTLVMVAKAVLSDVHLQLQLVGFHCLADPTLVLHLVVSLQVALHGCGAVCGVDAERAPGNTARKGRDRKRGVTQLADLRSCFNPGTQPLSDLLRRRKRHSVLPGKPLSNIWFISEDLCLQKVCPFNGIPRKTLIHSEGASL